MRINKAYHKIFPNNCAVIEETADGIGVGTCTYYLVDGICPRHGDVRPLIQMGKLSGDRETVRKILSHSTKKQLVEIALDYREWYFKLIFKVSSAKPEKRK